MNAFYALLAVVTAAGGTGAVLAACGVLRVQLARPTGAQRQAWREGGRHG